MKLFFLILMGLFLLACLHQANHLTGSSPKKLIIGLIMMFIGGVGLMLTAALDLFAFIDLLAFSFIIAGDLFWMAADRRGRRDRRA